MRILVAIAGLLSLLGTPATPQGLSDAEMAEALEQLQQAALRDAQALSGYSWQQRSEFLLKGKIKSFRLDEVAFATDGSLDYRRFGGKQGDMSSGKSRKFEDYLDRLMSLAQRYMYLDADRIVSANGAGDLTIERREGANWTKVHIQDYFKPGDRLDLVFDTSRDRLRTLEGSTYLERDEPVNVAIDFATLPDGTNYAATVTVDSPAEKVRVRIIAKGHRQSAIR